ncbi:site-specific integrase [Streptomyces lacrimifluminis]|uniref:Site-specific integrase n=1 Tax=Streptomyces lacrimifluminis TaxID=1500077 RepID=A0A917KX59_9ACTN|nr:site-specific integrase [Streptomyces lacrimifluminis]GGJ34468.1 site-specific integrase [Streptomyces lacrimifluminis]
MARRNANGEGTIYQRKDGRWVSSVWVQTTSGEPKRKYLYGKTRAEVSKKLTEVKAKDDQGIPTPDKAWKLSPFLDYWLEEVVKKEDALRTYEEYESISRLYLKPEIGSTTLTSIRVQTVQTLLSRLLEHGKSPRRVQTVKTTLSAALTYAMSKEWIGRNVARLATTPKYKPKKVVPWTVEEAQRFWEVAKEHRLAAAWGLATFYGLRRGEILGLRWQDVNLAAGEIQLVQQLHKVVAGEPITGPLKTDSSERTLPILGVIREGLARMNDERGRRPPSEHDLVFTTSKGTPISPRNFSDHMFKRLCKLAGVRWIKFHHTRHTATSMLELLGVSPKVAQVIMGHSSVLTTQHYYTHVYTDQVTSALQLVEQKLQETKTAQAEGTGRLMDVLDSMGSCQNGCQAGFWNGLVTRFISGGPTGDRTQDTLLKRSARDTLERRVSGVDAHLQDRRRRWLIGVVAVSVAVKATEGDSTALAA